MTISLKALPLAIALAIGSLTATAQTAPATSHHYMEHASFTSANDAVKALVKAMRSNNHHALHQVLGHEADAYILDKNSKVDGSVQAQFLKAYNEHSRLEIKDDSKAILHVGKNDWPLPFPLVKNDNRWSFDTEAGVQEWRDRRLGENELSAIQISLAYVDAQRDFVHRDLKHDGLMEYAQHIVSTEGQHDGLYWPRKAGEAASPMGQAFAVANKSGRKVGDIEHKPFHGYEYRILTAQGKSARGGELDYIVNGNLIGGFALIATPAHYGESGIKTFIVNHDGVVFSKDLGPDTEHIAAGINRYDPDESWKKEAL